MSERERKREKRKGKAKVVKRKRSIKRKGLKIPKYTFSHFAMTLSIIVTITYIYCKKFYFRLFFSII